MVDKPPKPTDEQAQADEKLVDPHYENDDQIELFLSLRVDNFLREFQNWLNSPLTGEEEEMIRSGRIDPDLDE
jgi:hypothetical protein